MLDEIRAGGSGSVDTSWSRNPVTGLGQNEDTKSINHAVQSDIRSGSGIVSVDLFCLIRTYRGHLGPFEQPVVLSQTLFGVRQTSYKATSSLLLGAGFSSVG